MVARRNRITRQFRDISAMEVNHRSNEDDSSRIPVRLKSRSHHPFSSYWRWSKARAMRMFTSGSIKSVAFHKDFIVTRVTIKVLLVCSLGIVFLSCWRNTSFRQFIRFDLGILSSKEDKTSNDQQAVSEPFRPVYPPLPDGSRDPNETTEMRYAEYIHSDYGHYDPMDFKTVYNTVNPEKLEWEEWYDNHVHLSGINNDPIMDYTTMLPVNHPEVSHSVPKSYPVMTKFSEIMAHWPQDDLDNPPEIFQEELMHFNFKNPLHMETALLFRRAELPFKVYNVPEFIDAGLKWDDKYLETGLNELKLLRNEERQLRRKENRKDSILYKTKGRSRPRKPLSSVSNNICQESNNNFFGYYIREKWNIGIRGPPPTKDNDWSFKRWAKHARYADIMRLSPNQKHFYYQVTLDESERFKPQDWSFITKDLSLLGGPTENFFMFNAKESKGVQCRFGERGVVTAMHFDTGKNMVAMITGAKRYILSPPSECSRFGIERNKKDSLFRHSMLNFGRMYSTESLPVFENKWMNISRDAQVIDTVLKAGEVLYIPSNWFHYIISLQKSTQCNTRSGDDVVTDSDGQQKINMACMD